MKILLVRPDQGSDFQITPPLGLGYIAASLKRQGHEVVLLDAAAVARTDVHSPDVVFIQVYTGSEEWAKRYILGYKIYVPRPRIIVGGHHVTATCDMLGADYGYNCEGESVHFYDDGSPHSNLVPIDPNDIPVPDWELLQPQRYWPYMQSANIPLKGKRPIPIISSRGCPYKCTFCASHVVAGRKFRPREVSNIIEEIKHLQWRYDCDEIWFSDDNLTFDYNRAISLFKAMIPLGIHWRAPNGIRVDRLTADMPKLMKESACYMVGLGVESGSPEILASIKKGILLHDVRIGYNAFSMG